MDVPTPRVVLASPFGGVPFLFSIPFRSYSVSDMDDSDDMDTLIGVTTLLLILR
jgi:hypothetical protein